VKWSSGEVVKWGRVADGVAMDGCDALTVVAAQHTQYDLVRAQQGRSKVQVALSRRGSGGGGGKSWARATPFRLAAVSARAYFVATSEHCSVPW
jgi:hypothetical protein